MSSPNQRGLLATIDKEKLVPGVSIDPLSSDFFGDLELLAPHIKDNEALYVILRRFPDASDGFIAVTYVPDAAPVRQKMLFASTRLTLVRELGIERFRETIFATTKAELTADGFRKHDKHVALAAPLTEEEQSLGAVKRAESEEGRGSNVKRSHISDHFAMALSNDALGALKKLGESGDEDSLVQLVWLLYYSILLPMDVKNGSNKYTRKSTSLPKLLSWRPQQQRLYQSCPRLFLPLSLGSHSSSTL